MFPELSAAQQEEVLAQALNAPLYKSTWHVPTYREGDAGDWRITLCPFHLEHGYVTGMWAVSSMPLLMRRTDDADGWEVWMSLTPHEIESQELACVHAHGHTVVMGLGMGWVAVNIAFNPAVREVTIIERDPRVIALFEMSGALDGVPEDARKKLRIVQADALEWIPDQPVDFLYVDIWRDLDEPQTLDQMQRIQAQAAAGTVYFWGQEIKLFAALHDRLDALRDAPPQVLRECAARVTELPLLVPDDGKYVAMIETVMAVRRSRGMSRG